MLKTSDILDEKEDITLVSDNPVVAETVGSFGIDPLEFLEE